MAKRLTRTDEVSAGDLFVLYKTSAGDYRGVPGDEVVKYVEDNMTPTTGDGYVTQYASPTTNSFDISINSTTTSTWLILTPSSAFAAGEVTLPVASTVTQNREVLVTCTRQIAAFNIDGNGATSVYGAPVTLAADDFFKLRFDTTTNSWYRVG